MDTTAQHYDRPKQCGKTAFRHRHRHGDASKDDGELSFTVGHLRIVCWIFCQSFILRIHAMFFTPVGRKRRRCTQSKQKQIKHLFLEGSTHSTGLIIDFSVLDLQRTSSSQLAATVDETDRKMGQRLAIAVVFISLAWLSSAFFTNGSPAIGSSHSQLYWSLCVEIDRVGEDLSCVVDRTTTVKTLNATYDLTSPREWLEFNELKYGNGAYTVLRCDYNIREGGFKIWGMDFHFDRLVESFKTVTNDVVDNTTNAETISNAIILALLKDTESTYNELKPESEENTFFTLMVTILWQPSESNMHVRGHAFSTLKPSTVGMAIPDPVRVTVAVDEQQALPGRFQHFPKSKLSSWCRRRRPLEQKFKSNGVGEVLLTRMDNDGKIQLLEGLTSNFFVMYPGNVLRTPATDCVLGGYARHLVLENAKRCGLEVEIGPIPLEDSPLWQEVFLTSSVKLIAPVGEILIPRTGASSLSDEEGENLFAEVWQQGSVFRDESTNVESYTPKWKELLHEILKSEGYEC